MKFLDRLIAQIDFFVTNAEVSEKNRQRSLDLARLKNQFGRPTYTKEQRQSGLAGLNTYDFTTITLPGLLVHLNQGLATQRKVLKDKITDKLIKAKQDPKILKPFLDNVAKAATKKDK